MESIKATKEEVERFLATQQTSLDSGCGAGYSPGFGYSSCSGCGSGCDYSLGSGYSFGSGSSYDSGYDRGDGSGDNYGYGYGYGDSYGSGDDYCTGDSYSSVDSDDNCEDFEDIIAINGNTIYCIDNIPTIITQVNINVAKGYIVKDDLTLSSCFIVKVDNSFVHDKTLKGAIAKAKEIIRLSVEEKRENIESV